MNFSTRPSRRSPLRTGAAVAAAAGLLTLGAPIAIAHDAVIGGDPADGATVSEFPESVTLEFSAEPREGFNTFALSDAETEEVLFSGEPAIDGHMLTLEIPEDVDPGAGDYRVGFQITSSDGHSTQGMTSFSVAGDAATTAPASETEAEAEAETETEEAEQDGLPSVPAWVIIGLSALALIAVVIMILRKGRMSRELDENTDHPENI
ncbi:copper resistance CopC family protein [Corynebacterium doosanense]|uniref:Membrane protein n=1 Tax=Corynebacterium doosanense CAU 212 = DSM 45436 TaxID=558173 RepID=A0A097IGL3_9CORY|nr:copper resistance CopC family protein [Corynebacterium doosanense]AIT61242.1 membrane protein [Corynebacterium doosanense CAU 212 = DSM 45436]